jgi:predicted MFS family arabinose efflux permease
MASLYAIAFFQFFSTMPLYYKDVAHLSEIQIGWLMALNGLLVAVFEMLIIYKYEKRWSLYNFIALGAFLLIPSYLSLLFFGGYAWLFVLTVVISFSEMFAMPFMNTFMNNRAQQGKRGQYASLYIMAWSSSQILTPIIATQIIGAGGYDMLWVVLASFAALCMVSVLWLKSKVAQ